MRTHWWSLPVIWCGNPDMGSRNPNSDISRFLRQVVIVYVIFRKLQYTIPVGIL